MTSGSSGRHGSGSKGFDFGSDDILCSYDDLGSQEGYSGKHTDPMVGNSPGNDFRESRKVRSGILPVYNQKEESLNQDVISTVEKTMKKYADNLMRFLEGISSRLSQLELYCYNLEKSVGEMRSDLGREHNEADVKLRSLEKHLQEVHRSVQILRDKQELADAQKELAKLQVAQKESLATAKTHLQQSEERVPPSPKNANTTIEVPNQQLALALPHQVAPPPPSLPTSQIQTQPQPQPQPQPYYQPPSQLPNPQTQTPQEQYHQPDPHYKTPQYPAYQQQWPQQYSPQVQQPQQAAPRPPIQPQTTSVYPPYQPNQSTNPPPETFPGNTPSQIPFAPESMPYNYPGAGRAPVQQSPQQHNIPRQPQPQPQPQPQLQSNPSAFGPHPTQSSGQGYMMYNSEGGRASHQSPTHFPQGGYPPTHVPSIQNPQPGTGGGLLLRHPSPSPVIRGHPYGELIEKAVSMGYGRDHVVSAIQRLEGSGQPVDFNGVLDMLNLHSSGVHQRGWSG